MSVFRFALQTKLNAVVQLVSNHQVGSTIKSNAASPRQANLPIVSISGPARATSEKALAQSDPLTTLPQNDTRLVDSRADSTVLSMTSESHARTKEVHGAHRTTNVTLSASSERRGKTAKPTQTSLDGEEARTLLAKIS